MKKYLNPALALLFTLLLVLPSFGQVVQKDQYEGEIKDASQKIQEWMKQQQIPGVQIAVMKHGEIIWSEGFGYADLELKVPMTPVIKMRVGSVSKTFTAAAMGLLMEQNLLDPDAPVQKYVAYFPKKRHPVTSRQLAGHLAGIRHYKGNEFLMNKPFSSVREGIAIFENDSLLFKPGTKYSYTSYGYNLLSGVIEGASGEDFLTFMEENVFSPLEMTQTTADFSEMIIPNRTSFYAVQDSMIVNAPVVNNSYKWAGGGFLSTCEDILKFGNAHLSEKFLKKKTIDELWKTQATADGKATGYGMGWDSKKNENGSWHGHSGGSVGGTTQFIMYPEHGIVLAMMANSGNVSYKNLHHEIASLFFD